MYLMPNGWRFCTEHSARVRPINLNGPGINLYSGSRARKIRLIPFMATSGSRRRGE